GGVRGRLREGGHRPVELPARGHYGRRLSPRTLPHTPRTQSCTPGLRARITTAIGAAICQLTAPTNAPVCGPVPPAKRPGPNPPEVNAPASHVARASTAVVTTTTARAAPGWAPPDRVSRRCPYQPASAPSRRNTYPQAGAWMATPCGSGSAPRIGMAGRG